MGLCETIRSFVCGDSGNTLPATVERSAFQQYRDEQREVPVREIEVCSSETKLTRDLEEIRAKKVLMEDRLTAEDAAHLEEIRNGWSPVITINDYKAGTFVGYDGKEWPVRFIVDIKIREAGAAPEAEIGVIGHDYSMRHGPFYLQSADTTGKIQVSLSTGTKEIIEVNRHKLPFVHEALSAAWKQPKDEVRGAE